MRTSHGAPSSRTRWRPSWAWHRLVLVLAVAAFGSGSAASAADPKPPVRFDRVVIDDHFPGAYQVEVADVNGDGKPDVVALGGGTCAWYENPTWTKRVVTGPKQTPGVISSATADLDGDGKAEIAIAYEFAMNVPTRGKLLLARQGKAIDDPWILEQVADIGSIHRLRWWRYGPGKTGSSRPERSPAAGITRLVVAPIFGPSARPPLFDQEPAHLEVVNFPNSPRSGVSREGGPLASLPASPSRQRIGEVPVLHAIDVVDLRDNGFPAILSASNSGVTMHWLRASDGGVLSSGSDRLVAGAPGEAPRKGASEVHAGRLKDGRRFLTTVEPWHGTDVAVYLSESLDPPKFGPRTVIDTSLKEGHALWVADVDGDGDDEVFAGYRGPGTSVLLFDYNGKTWDRTVIDADIAAQDLRGGDLDGNGTPDVVAVGGKTHNVVWYRPRTD